MHTLLKRKLNQMTKGAFQLIIETKQAESIKGIFRSYRERIWVKAAQDLGKGETHCEFCISFIIQLQVAQIMARESTNFLLFLRSHKVVKYCY